MSSGAVPWTISAGSVPTGARQLEAAVAPAAA
jgi:hypothetical protein